MKSLILLFLVLATSAFADSSTAKDVVYVPKNLKVTKYGPAMIVMLHGCKTDAYEFAQGTGMNAFADRFGFVVFYPQQPYERNIDRCWNWFLGINQYHNPYSEADLLMARIRQVRAQFGVDPSRVYVAGMSSGAGMAAILASCFANEFAAVAMHSGVSYEAAKTVDEANEVIVKGQTFPTELSASHAYGCSMYPRRMMPLITFHGTSDTRVNPVNTNSAIMHFLRFNDMINDGFMNGNVSLTPSRMSNVRGNPQKGERDYLLSEYDYGGKVLVRSVLVSNMEHAWSGGDSRLPRNDDKGPSATQMIVSFFGLGF